MRNDANRGYRTKLIGNGPLVTFIRELRELRDKAGLTYRDIGARAFQSHEGMYKVVSGTELPSLERLQVFVNVCGGDVEQWTNKWHELNKLSAAQLFDNSVGPREMHDFKQALLAMQQQTKGVTIRRIASRYGNSYTWTRERLAPGAHLPPRNLVACVVGLCGGDVAEWDKAWCVLAAKYDRWRESIVDRGHQLTASGLTTKERRAMQLLLQALTVLTGETFDNPVTITITRT